MARGALIRAAERSEIRRRIVAGERPLLVAAALGRSLSTVHAGVRREGGRRHAG